MNIEKKEIAEILVVEGRDDTAAINRAVNAETIETHGFGIKKETWSLIEKAYKENGIIIFTDPDFAGNEIRRKLLERFPNAKEAFLSKKDATRKNDIGIENASPEAIREALAKAHCTITYINREKELFTMEDMFFYGLVGCEKAAENRDKLGKALGIGYGNGSAFLKKLNKYNISKEEFKQSFD